MPLPCLAIMLLPLANPLATPPPFPLVTPSPALPTMPPVAQPSSSGASVLVSSAQEDVLYGPEAGDYLLSFSANYRYAKASAPDSDADETEIFSGRGTVGLFFTREHEAGLELNPNYVTTELGGSNFETYLGGYYNYNMWSSPQANFYAGPQLGFLYTDPSGSSAKTFFSWGFHAGLRYWINPSVSLNVEPRVSFTGLDRARGGDETVVDMSFGVSFKF